MKTLMQMIMAILVLTMVNPGFAQTKEEKREAKIERKQQKKLLKAERQNEEEQRLKENYERIVSLVRDSSFVIEAHTLFDRYNNSYPVSPATNFVMVEGDQITLQLGFMGVVGANGLGGLTIEGNIGSFEILDTTDNGSYRIRMNVNSLLLGTTEVGVAINRDGSARAYVRGTFRTRFSFNGILTSLEESTVHKGIVNYW